VAKAIASHLFQAEADWMDGDSTVILHFLAP